jgi:predicted lactoylglutathione lyase
MIKAVKFVNIPVRDQEQALAFYTRSWDSKS